MIEKKRLYKILALAFPIIGGMASQNILNLIDTAMVGTLGNISLAAVGIGGFVSFFCQSILIGLSTGVQTITARRIGENRFNEAAYPLNSSLLIIVTLGSLLTVLLYLLVPAVYPFINSDPEVIKVGVPYLQVRVISTVFVGINFSFRGFWNGINKPTIYFKALITMHISNIILNYILIFGKFGFPELGTFGAGLATTLSLSIGPVIYFIQGIRLARPKGFLSHFPDSDNLKNLLKVSLPTSIQQLFFSAGFVTLYWIIGKVGTIELAAANILINIMLVVILPGLGLGMASATLVSQSIGMKKYLEAKQWGWDVGKVGLLIVLSFSFLALIYPEKLISVFINDLNTIALAKKPLLFTAIAIPFDVFGLIMMNSLFGAGDTKRVMKVAISLQWLLFLPLAYLIGPILGNGLFGIWVLQGAYRSLQALVFSIMWKNDKWKVYKV